MSIPWALLFLGPGLSLMGVADTPKAPCRELWPLQAWPLWALTSQNEGRGEQFLDFTWATQLRLRT